MKRSLFTLIVALSLMSFTSFANEVKVSQTVLKSFKSSFKSATDVDWSVTANYFKATFVYNSQYISAYFDQDGAMVAETRNISSFQLPLVLQTSLKNDYDSFWISDLFEVANADGTTYYVTLESGNTKIILKSVSNTEWNSYSKITKS